MLFTVVSSVPFIGPLFILFGQAASAHLFYDFYVKEGEQLDKPKKKIN